MRETIDLVLRDTPTFPVFRDRLKARGLNVFVRFDKEERCPNGILYRARDLDVPVELFGSAYRMNGLLKRGLTFDYDRDGEVQGVVRPEVPFTPLAETDVTWVARDLAANPLPRTAATRPDREITAAGCCGRRIRGGGCSKSRRAPESGGIDGRTQAGLQDPAHA